MLVPLRCEAAEHLLEGLDRRAATQLRRTPKQLFMVQPEHLLRVAFPVENKGWLALATLLQQEHQSLQLRSLVEETENPIEGKRVWHL